MLSMVNRGFKKDPEGDKEEKIEVKRDGETTLSGSMTRQVSLLLLGGSQSGWRHGCTHFFTYQTEQDQPLQEYTSHVTNIGKMIEDMEIKMRNLLQEVRVICV